MRGLWAAIRAALLECRGLLLFALEVTAIVVVGVPLGC